MRRRIAAIALGLLAPLASTTPASATSPENAMTLWSCAPDNGSYTTVDITWVSAHTATVTWLLKDERADGKAPRLKVRAVDHNGSHADTYVDFFGGGELDIFGGLDASRSGTRTWTPAGISAFDELEIWLNNGIGREAATCGWEFSHRMNNYLHSETRTAPTSYAKSKAVRDRIVAVAYAEMRAGYHERAGNCSKYTDYLVGPSMCRPWCADFAFYTWAKAGVPWARTYASSYAEDVRAEWRIQFKPVYGDRLPALGDIAVFRHPVPGRNGHEAVVVGTDGWRVLIIDGNHNDEVAPAPHWVDPADNGPAFKDLIGFASPV